MADTTPHAEAFKKLGELIDGIQFAMLTSVSQEGTLHSRPMATQQVEFDGDLWFFTGASTEKVGEVQHEHQVNVAYADPQNQRYVSVAGTARLVRDQAKIKELWKPALKAWFPKGLDDPDLALLKVEVASAEYWDSPSSTVAQVVGFAKALVTGQRAQMGENEQLKLS